MYIYMYIVNKYAVICVMNCDVLFASKQQSSEEKQKKKNNKGGGTKVHCTIHSRLKSFALIINQNQKQLGLFVLSVDRQ